MKLVHTQKCQLTNSIEVSCMLAKRSDELENERRTCFSFWSHVQRQM